MSTNDSVLQNILLEIHSTLKTTSGKLEDISSNDYLVYVGQLDELTSKLKDGFVQDTYFVCAGEFSAGKSTFINAILNENLLPTADRPCTSVITEIRFVESGGMRAKIVFIDGKEDFLTFEDYKILADGATKKIGTLSSIHHVELYFDIQNSDEDYPLLRTLKELGIIFVDTPGFGSPYPINEEVIAEYIDIAAFGLWFFPVDRFGGVACKNMLRKLSSDRRKLRIIPILTKSDLLKGDNAKEDVLDDFINTLGDCFSEQTPEFMSALVYKQSMEQRFKAYKEKDENKRNELLTLAEKLEFESGIENVASKIAQKTRSKTFTGVKVDEIIRLIEDYTKIIQTPLTNIKNKNQKALSLIGWKEGYEYSKIDGIKKALELWAKTESTKIAETFKDSLVESSMELINNSNKATVVNELEKTIKLETIKLRETIVREAIPYILQKYNVQDLNFSTDGVDIQKGKKFILPQDVLKERVMVLFRTIESSGASSLAKGGIGASVIVGSQLAVSSVVWVPAIVGTIGAILGGALILTAAASIIPVYMEKVKSSKDAQQKMLRHNIEIWIKNTNFNIIIANVLQEIIDDGANCAKSELQPKLYELLKVSDTISAIDANISALNEKAKSILPQYTTKRKGF